MDVFGLKLDEQYQIAYKILDENRDKMETMCKALMEWETIDRDQVLEIMAGKQPSPPKDYSHNLRENADAAEDNAPHAPAREETEAPAPADTASTESEQQPENKA